MKMHVYLHAACSVKDFITPTLPRPHYIPPDVGVMMVGGVKEEAADIPGSSMRALTSLSRGSGWKSPGGSAE